MNPDDSEYSSDDSIIVIERTPSPQQTQQTTSPFVTTRVPVTEASRKTKDIFSEIEFESHAILGAACNPITLTDDDKDIQSTQKSFLEPTQMSLVKSTQIQDTDSARSIAHMAVEESVATTLSRPKFDLLEKLKMFDNMPREILSTSFTTMGTPGTLEFHLENIQKQLGELSGAKFVKGIKNLLVEDPSETDISTHRLIQFTKVYVLPLAGAMPQMNALHLKQLSWILEIIGNLMQSASLPTDFDLFNVFHHLRNLRFYLGVELATTHVEAEIRAIVTKLS